MRYFPNLMNRNGHFYFRISVPLALRPYIEQRELLYSLRTKDPIEARTRCLAVGEAVRGILKRAQTGERITEWALKESLFKVTFINDSNDARLNIAPVPPLPAPIPETHSPALTDGNALSMVYAAYLAECKGDRDKTLDKKKGVLSLWLEIVGDGAITATNKERARYFKTVLMRLPVNMKQRYRGKSIKEIDLDRILEDERLSIKTINDKLIWMCGFMNWAIRNGYYEAANPFSGLSLKEEESPETKKNPFSMEQLEAIFSTPVFCGCESKTMHGKYEKGEKIIKDGLYWVPLIALYSGARMQEICQLYVADIRKFGEVWAFDFNEDGPDKRLKTASSKRKTPVHPKLIELGLLEYCEEQADKGHKRMFPDLPLANDGTYSSNFSKRFNHFLKRFDIKTDKTSFHSFRHTFIDALRNTEVHKEVRQALVGHLDAKTAHDTYGSAIGLRRLYEGIVQLEYKLPLV